jgi:hypothetical protein
VTVKQIIPPWVTGGEDSSEEAVGGAAAKAGKERNKDATKRPARKTRIRLPHDFGHAE